VSCFEALERSGRDIHGEADFCATLAPTGAVVLDAGCGAGRVAIELGRRGYRCTGVDRDPAMLAAAQRLGPDVTWVEADLATLDLVTTFDVVVAAGNVVPLVAPGTEAAVMAALARHLAPDGRLVTGFGLDAAHLPLDEAPFGLDAYDAWCDAAGLRLVDRFSTWDGVPYDASTPGYAVSVHTQA
jgi:SAM-dependent methyltransferase